MVYVPNYDCSIVVCRKMLELRMESEYPYTGESQNIESWDKIDEQTITMEMNRNKHQMLIVEVYASSDDGIER